MTSKNLFFKLSKDDLKRRIWVIALFSLILVIALPISTALQLTNYDPAYSYRNVTNPFRFAFTGISAITIVFALIAGLSSFSYLHSRTKVDLYHSLPVKRSVLFAVNYINSIIIYIVPYVITSCITYGIIAFHGKMQSYVIIDSIKSMAINLIFFMILYGLSSIATILTGNIIVAFLGTGVFYVYGFMVMGIKEIIVSNNFLTYSAHNKELDFIMDINPIYHYGFVFSSGNLSGLVITKLILGVILLAGIAYLLFRYRPSEASNKAMAYSWTKPVIKVALLIPIGFYGGQVFAGYSYNDVGGNIGWNIFGIAFVGIIVGAIIEIIYDFDIKAAFKGKRLLLGSLILSYGLFAVIQMDIINYDKLIPKKSNIVSASVSIDNLDTYINYFEDREVTNSYLLTDGIQRVDYMHVNYSKSRLDNMNMTNIDDIYKLALIGTEDAKANRKVYDDIFNYSIRFKLKNGKEIYRVYRVEKDKVWEILSSVYDNIEMKESVYPILLNNAEDFKSVKLRNILNSSEFQLQENDKANLLDALKKDILSSTLEDRLSKQVYGFIRFVETTDRYHEYYILSTYTNTITYLESIGYQGLGNVYDATNITRINMYDPLIEGVGYGEKYQSEYIDSTKDIDMSSYEFNFTEKEDIIKIMDIIKEKGSYDNSIGLNFNTNNIQASVWYNNTKMNESNQITFYLDYEAYNEIVK